MEHYPTVEPARWEVLGASSVVAVHTGDTAETVLATIALPAGMPGANGFLRVWSLWATPGGNGNTKTMRWRLGGLLGTAFFSAAPTTNLSHQDLRLVGFRNSLASQTGPAAFGALTTSGSALTAGTIDLATAKDIVLTAQLANGSDSIRLESYLVEILRRA